MSDHGGSIDRTIDRGNRAPVRRALIVSAVIVVAATVCYSVARGVAIFRADARPSYRLPCQWLTPAELGRHVGARVIGRGHREPQEVPRQIMENIGLVDCHYRVQSTGGDEWALWIELSTRIDIRPEPQDISDDEQLLRIDGLGDGGWLFSSLSKPGGSLIVRVEGVWILVAGERLDFEGATSVVRTILARRAWACATADQGRGARNDGSLSNPAGGRVAPLEPPTVFVQGNCLVSPPASTTLALKLHVGIAVAWWALAALAAMDLRRKNKPGHAVLLLIAWAVFAPVAVVLWVRWRRKGDPARLRAEDAIADLHRGRLERALAQFGPEAINRPSITGWPLLHQALNAEADIGDEWMPAIRPRLVLSDVIVEHGADLEARIPNGLTALDLARALNHQEFLDYIAARQRSPATT